MLLEGITPWPEEFARRYREKGYWQDETIPGFFAKLVGQQPGREALVQGDRRVPLGELWEQSGRLAANFLRIGLKRHDRVVFQLPNSIELLTVFFALTRIGAIPVMALPPHRETEVTHFARSSGAVALFIPDRAKDFDYRTMAEAVQVKVPGVKHVFVLGQALSGQFSLAELAASPVGTDELTAVDRVPLDPNDVVFMLFPAALPHCRS